MKNNNLEQLKKIIEKYGYSNQPEDLLEISQNIRQLADVILSFEKKKKSDGLSPPTEEK